MKVMSTWIFIILTGYCHIDSRRGRVPTHVRAGRPKVGTTQLFYNWVSHSFINQSSEVQHNPVLFGSITVALRLQGWGPDVRQRHYRPPSAERRNKTRFYSQKSSFSTSNPTTQYISRKKLRVSPPPPPVWSHPNHEYAKLLNWLGTGQLPQIMHTTKHSNVESTCNWTRTYHSKRRNYNFSISTNNPPTFMFIFLY